MPGALLSAGDRAVKAKGSPSPVIPLLSHWHTVPTHRARVLTVSYGTVPVYLEGGGTTALAGSGSPAGSRRALASGPKLQLSGHVSPLSPGLCAAVTPVARCADART